MIIDSPGRRSFLELTSTACATLLLPGCALRIPDSARIVVAGGGFAGMMAAREIRRLSPSVHITLIEQNRIHVSCPGSNQVIAGLKAVDTLFHASGDDLQGQDISVLYGEISSVEINRRQLILSDRTAIPWDRLIVAPGIDFRWDAIEGYDEKTSEQIPHAWKAGYQTELLRRQVQAMPDGGTLVITVPANPYRCPPGPYERASLIASYFMRHKPKSKVIVLDAKTRFSKQAAFMQAWQELYPDQIEWISPEKQGNLDHIEARQRTVHTEFGSIRADVLNVIPPQKAGKLAAMMSLADSSGWCPVDPLTFESTRQPGIHVIGDACIASPMPKSAFAAQSQARACALAIASQLAGTSPLRPRLINHCYSFVDTNEAISITGVYGYDVQNKSLLQLAGGETPPDGDRKQEARHARSWYQLMMKQTFG